jgi:hypothetical protein
MEIVVRAPDPPKVGDNPIEITVRKDAAPIQDASVTAMFSMPAMPSMNMPEMHAGTTLKHEDGGVFRGTVRLSMAGTWNATVTVARGDEVLGTSSHSIVAK